MWYVQHWFIRYDSVGHVFVTKLNPVWRDGCLGHGWEGKQREKTYALNRNQKDGHVISYHMMKVYIYVCICVCGLMYDMMWYGVCSVFRASSFEVCPCPVSYRLMSHPARPPVFFFFFKSSVYYIYLHMYIPTHYIYMLHGMGQLRSNRRWHGDLFVLLTVVGIDESIDRSNNQMLDLKDWTDALKGGLPPVKLPKYVFGTAGCYSFMEEKLRPLLEYEDLKAGVFQAREQGRNATVIVFVNFVFVAVLFFVCSVLFYCK